MGKVLVLIPHTCMQSHPDTTDQDCRHARIKDYQTSSLVQVRLHNTERLRILPAAT
jgi:hypothetical protein